MDGVGVRGVGSGLATVTSTSWFIRLSESCCFPLKGCNSAKKAFCLATISVLSIGANASLADQTVRANALGIDPDRLKGRITQFEISPEGVIVDGPRQAKGEPIDYSPVLTAEAISYLFAQSITSCSEGIRYCGTDHYRMSHQNIVISLASDTDEGGDLLREVEAIFDQTLGLAGFSRQIGAGDQSFDLVIQIGPIERAKEYMREIDDQYGFEYYEYLEKNQYSDQILAYFSPCYLSTKSREDGMASMFVTEGSMASCLPKLYLALVGLNETPGAFPSVTAIDGQYKTATLADRAFVYAMAQPDFPIKGDLRQLEDYFGRLVQSNSNVREILDWKE
jgi:hypothetical protein